MNTTIKCWAEDDRPREKMMLKGRSVLSDAELLAIIIGSGTRNLSAVELAKQLLNDVGNDFNGLAKRSIKDLMKYKGVGEAKAISISATLEIARRKGTEQKLMNPIIRSSKDCFNQLKSIFEDLLHEEFYVLCLNRANRIITIEQISKGGISGTVADGKIIFKKALENNASSIILAHNHPSGQLKPSDADKRLTKHMSEFGKMIDLQVLDHLIIAENNFYSFADVGEMD